MDNLVEAVDGLGEGVASRVANLVADAADERLNVRLHQAPDALDRGILHPAG